MINPDLLAALPWTWVALAVLCLLLAAFGTMAATVMEAAGGRFRALSTDPDADKGNPYWRLLDRPEYYLSTALLIARVSVVVGTVLATGIAVQVLPLGPALLGTMVVVSVAAILLGEIAPRSLASQDLTRTARLIGPALRAAAWCMMPLLWLLGLIANSTARLFGLKPMARAPLVTEAELLGLINIGRQEGIIEEDEREMISGIFELEETLAREIMVPRIDMVGVSTDATIDGVVEVMIRHGYSRIPLYEENLDHIVGLLYVKDLLKALYELRRGAPAPDIRSLVRPVPFVPETKRVNELLHDLQATRVHLAIVVDEYGGTAGLVTIEDLLEEIVGEIKDEFDVEEDEVVPVSEDEAIMSGRASVYELEERFGHDVGESEADTIGGFVYGHLGRMPEVGDVILVEGDLKLTVLDVAGNRIRRVRVQRLRDQPEMAAGDGASGPGRGA